MSLKYPRHCYCADVFVVVQRTMADTGQVREDLFTTRRRAEQSYADLIKNGSHLYSRVAMYNTMTGKVIKEKARYLAK